MRKNFFISMLKSSYLHRTSPFDCGERLVISFVSFRSLFNCPTMRHLFHQQQIAVIPSSPSDILKFFRCLPCNSGDFPVKKDRHTTQQHQLFQTHCLMFFPNVSYTFWGYSSERSFQEITWSRRNDTCLDCSFLGFFFIHKDEDVFSSPLTTRPFAEVF